MIKKIHIGVLGPQYTNSDFAVDYYQKLLSIKAEKKYYPTITDIFDAVEKGNVEQGIIPIENSTGGMVNETIQQIVKRGIVTVAAFAFEIHYSLVALPETSTQNITKIISHEQPLKQCQAYLNKNFPQALKKTNSSTTASLQKILDQKDTSAAVIISCMAAKEFNVRILAERIEDNHNNTTTFMVIGKK